MADSLDHVIPQSLNGNTSYSREFVVPCCRECNSNLGNSYLHSIEKRALFLLDTYQRKWKNDLNITDWEDDELAELGFHLRSKIEQDIARKKLCQLRLLHLEKVVTTKPQISDVWA